MNCFNVLIGSLVFLLVYVMTNSMANFFSQYGTIYENKYKIPSKEHTGARCQWLQHQTTMSVAFLLL